MTGLGIPGILTTLGAGGATYCDTKFFSQATKVSHSSLTEFSSILREQLRLWYYITNKECNVMQDQPEFQAVGGQLHRVVYQPIDESSVDAEVAAQLDAAQAQLSQATQTREQAEQVYTNAEAAAEAASLELDAAKKAEEEAEGALQKSVSSRDSLARARELAVQQLEQVNVAEGDPGDDDGEDEELAESGAVPVAVNGQLA